MQAITGNLKPLKQPITEGERPFESAIDPETYLQKEISYADHSKRENRPIIPALMPLGVDFEDIANNREKAIANRIISRMVELEKMPTNIEGFTFAHSEEKKRDLKTRLLIEYKGLRLLDRQRAIREKMLHSIPTFTSLAATHDRAQYRRLKTQSLRESRATTEFERQQKTERERREKQKHFDYLAGITAHVEEVIEQSNTVRAKAQKLGKAVLSYHTYIEKEEQRRYERLSKQRIAALKANDETAYLALVDTAKDTRIAHLLHQTNQYLGSLAEQIKAQQGHSATLGPADMPPEAEALVEEQIGEVSEEAQEQDYYKIAHKVQEEVTEQPSILVGGNLKAYQLQGLQWMVSLYNNRLNGILADEMGLGKTIQTISLITFLIEKKRQNGPFLVIVPLSTLTNWTLEFEKWAPSVHKIVFKGSPAVRKNLGYSVRQGAFQVLLTTYEYIIKDRNILSRIKWVHMIIDEGHRMKNANSKLSNTLVQFYNTRHRLILTGTPLQNNLPELWALLNFVLPKIFNSVKSFDEWFNTPFANTGGAEKIELSEEESLLVIRRLHKVLRPFLLRRLKKDVEKDLPDKVENVIKCQMSGLQKKLYDQMKKHGMLFVSEEGKSKQGIKGLNNTLMQLRKICNHPFVFEEVEQSICPDATLVNDYLWRSCGKFELLDRVLPKFKRTGHRVLMFFQMTQIMNIMEDFLHYRGLKYMRLDGGTKSDDRSLLLKDFNAPDSEYFVFLLSTRAGGLGLNLQTADTVIIFDSDWNPHQDLQAQDRAHRIGQTKEVRILRLITEKSIEESILARAQYKLDMDGKVIQAGKFDNKSTAEEREAFLRALLDADPASIDDDKDSEKGEDYEDDDDLNEIIARNDEELKLFREMDIDRDMLVPYGPTHELPRLMSEKELPPAYHKDHDVLVTDFFSIAGPGKRERKETAYDDGLTEEEWLRAVDEGEDLAELSKKGRGARNKLTNDVSQATSPAASSTGKRSRHSRAASIDPVEPTPRKRVRTGAGPSSLGKRDSLSTAARSALTKIFNTILQKMDEAEYQTEGAPDRGRTDVFLVLPPRKMYPDYYQLIRRPISIKEIKHRIKTNEYSTIHEFRGDFELMFANARKYNEEGSFVWDDVAELERILKAELDRMAPGGNPDLKVIRAEEEPDDSEDLSEADAIMEDDESE